MHLHDLSSLLWMCPWWVGLTHRSLWCSPVELLIYMHVALCLLCDTCTLWSDKFGFLSWVLHWVLTLRHKVQTLIYVISAAGNLACHLCWHTLPSPSITERTEALVHHKCIICSVCGCFNKCLETAAQSLILTDGYFYAEAQHRHRAGPWWLNIPTKSSAWLSILTSKWQ